MVGQAYSLGDYCTPPAELWQQIAAEGVDAVWPGQLGQSNFHPSEADFQ